MGKIGQIARKPLSFFTGKERDEETGYGYFGARYMDHELMTMWLSVDPLADKYPSISPYAYCAWNPIKLVDPNGEEIWIKGSDGNEYQYKNGNLYNKDGTAYEGDDKFATGVQKDLNTLKAKGMRKEVESLEGSNNKHTIKYSSDKNDTDPGEQNNKNASNGVGCGTTISYNPDATETEGWQRHAVVGLAHETRHAYEMDQGKYDNTPIICEKEQISITPEPRAYRKTFKIPTTKEGFVYYSRVVKSKNIERGEYSAILAANRVYMALGGTSPRKTINGFPISQLKK